MSLVSDASTPSCLTEYLQHIIFSNQLYCGLPELYKKSPGIETVFKLQALFTSNICTHGMSLLTEWTVDAAPQSTDVKLSP